MALTTAQYITFKTDINSKLNTVISGATIATHIANTKFDIVASYYNSQASPQVDLWEPDVATEDLAKNIIMSEFIVLTAIKQNGFLVYQQGTYIDATNINVRNGFTSIFGAGAVSVTNLTALAKKPATNFESLFTVSNVCSVYKYIVTAQDIETALRS